MYSSFGNVLEHQEHNRNGSFSDKNELILRSIGIVVIVTLAFQFFFILFNVFKYLIPLKVKSPFMSVFYLLAGIFTLGRIVEVLIFVLPTTQ